MKTVTSNQNSSYEPATIQHYLKQAKQTYNLRADLTVKDLTRISRPYAVTTLSTMLQTDVKDLDNRLIWQDNSDYASSFTFEADDKTPIYYIDDGCLQMMYMEKLNPESLPRIGIEFDCYEFCLSWGELLDSKEGTEYAGKRFLITVPWLAKHVLISARWGGSRNLTRGNTAINPASSNGICLFERRQSKRGKEGLDHYVFSLDDVKMKEWSRSQIDQILHQYLKAEKDFALKYDLCQKMDKQYGVVDSIRNQVQALLYECETFRSQDEELNRPFIFCPSISDLSQKLPERSYALSEMTYEQLQTYYISARSLQTYWLAVDEAKILIEAWKEFAPKYAKLYERVMKNHGMLMIYGDHAVIRVQENTKILAGSTGKSVVADHKFSFTYGQLQGCIEFITKRENTEKIFADSWSGQQEKRDRK